MSDDLRFGASQAREGALLLQRQVEALEQMGLYEHARGLRESMARLLAKAIELERAASEVESREPLLPRSPAPRLPGET